MPELPDVARFKKYLDATSLHQAIRRAVVHDRDLLEDVSAQRLRRILQGRSFKSTDRWGNSLFVELDEGPCLVMHFGMTGYLDYREISKQIPDHTRVAYQFEGGQRLTYVCQRKLGRVTFAHDIESFVQSRNLGPDGLDEQLGFEAFCQRLSGRRGAIKSALMNQQIVAGIGNIYSDEILFQARVHPKRPVNELDDGQLQSVYRVLRKVLRKDHITFIWRFLLHPAARSSYTKAVIHDIARHAGDDSILTMWHGTLEMPESDLVDMGFAKIGGSQLPFRDLHLQVPYAARHPLGEEIDFDARPEHEEWVLKQWKT